MAPNSTAEKNENPNKHLEIPKWINEDYFQPILAKELPDYSHILKFTSVAATPPGENYTSIMVRVHVNVALKDGNCKELSYILKTAFEAINMGTEMLNSMHLFPKEMQMYQVLLPKFTSLYKEVGADIKLNPNCLHIEETSERITLVLEDLKQKNFKNIDRLKGFDMSHMRCVLQKLAELHAVSTMYYELNGPYDDIYELSFFNEQNRTIFESMAATRHAIFEKAMLAWGLENVEKYIARIPSSMEYFDEAIRINEYDSTEFNVLNHGDCWSNNIMFNYKENGDIDETIFVDFQLGKWGTPAQDLWYLITTSVSLDIKVKEFDHFIYIYHERLVKCLNLLKYPKAIPTLKEMHIMMIKYGFWGILTAHGVMTATLYPSDKDANMDNLMKPGPEGDEFRYKTFTNPYYVKACCQLYPFFENKGIFDLHSESKCKRTK